MKEFASPTKLENASFNVTNRNDRTTVDWHEASVSSSGRKEPRYPLAKTTTLNPKP